MHYRRRMSRHVSFSAPRQTRLRRSAIPRGRAACWNDGKRACALDQPRSASGWPRGQRLGAAQAAKSTCASMVDVGSCCSTLLTTPLVPAPRRTPCISPGPACADLLSALLRATSSPTLGFLLGVGLAVQRRVCLPTQASLAVVDLLPQNVERTRAMREELDNTCKHRLSPAAPRQEKLARAAWKYQHGTKHPTLKRQLAEVLFLAVHVLLELLVDEGLTTDVAKNLVTFAQREQERSLSFGPALPPGGHRMRTQHGVTASSGQKRGDVEIVNLHDDMHSWSRKQRPPLNKKQKIKGLSQTRRATPSQSELSAWHP